MKKTFLDFFYFALIQASNYLLPLITFPYLVRIFQMEKFGQYVLIQTVLSYFILIGEFGFNVTGVKKIGETDSVGEQSAIFNRILSAKLLLLSGSLTCILIASLFVPEIKNNFSSYLIGFPLVIGQSLFPIWYFQAIQKMRTATIINVSIKIFFTLCIFLFVNNPSHLNLALAFNSIGFFVGGLVAVATVFIKHGLVFQLPGLKETVEEIKESWRVFASRVFTSLYSSTNILVLAYLKSPALVGQYSAADKVFRGLYNVSVPFIQVFFPKQAQSYSSSKARYAEISRRIFYILSVSSILIGVGIFWFSPEIVRVVVGSADKTVETVLRIFAFSAVLYPFGALFTNMLVIQNMNKTLLRAVSYSAAINFVLVVPAIYYFSIEGLAYLSLITQLWIFFYKGSAVLRNLKKSASPASAIAKEQSIDEVVLHR